MNINTKNKKIIASIVGIVAGVTLVSSLLYSKINTAENENAQIYSVLLNIRTRTIETKQTLRDLQVNMMKLNQDKDKIIQIDKIIEDMERSDYTDESKINDNIKQLDRLNEEIDSMIAIYNADENMKKDMTISNTMLEIEGLNGLIDNLMHEYNTEYAPNFNKLIEKFPVNVVAKSKGWFEVDKFSSVE